MHLIRRLRRLLAASGRKKAPPPRAILSLDRLDERVLPSVAPLPDPASLVAEPISDAEQAAGPDGSSEAAPAAAVPSETASAASDARLRDLLLEAIPGLGDALANDRLEGARLLRDWAANATNYALSPQLSLATTALALKDSAADLYFNVFAPGAGGVYCAGYAFFYDKVLKLFDYNSFVVDFGDLQGALTHATVIVPLPSGDAWDYYVMDPTFNASFRDRGDGRPLTFFELMDFLHDGRAEDVAVENPAPNQRSWVSLDPLDRTGFIPAGQVDGVYVYSRPGYGLQTFLDTYRDTFLAYGYSPGLQGLIQLMENRVFYVGTSLDPASATQFVSELVRRAIPLGCPLPPAPTSGEQGQDSPPGDLPAAAPAKEPAGQEEHPATRPDPAEVQDHLHLLAVLEPGSCGCLLQGGLPPVILPSEILLSEAPASGIPAEETAPALPVLHLQDLQNLPPPSELFWSDLAIALANRKRDVPSYPGDPAFSN
jgi:hypothetical protein